MCGLAGFLDPTPLSNDASGERIRAMTASLHRRGPDAEGHWLNDGIALGHRRLAIIELSEAGAQPMISQDGRFVIAFNGEIYNHLELRSIIEKSAAEPKWRGHSDTETLLACIAHWGIDETLQRAHGMFAIAVWDTQRKNLILARDRMGEKPLYWGFAGRALVFASELKALRKHPDFPRQVCREALAQYMRFGYIPSPRSIHPNIYKLEPGSILEVDSLSFSRPDRPLRPGEHLGPLRIRQYWSLNHTIESGLQAPILNEDDAAFELSETLENAIVQQMISDVPLGAFLSGGIDSSLIVALMQKRASQPIKTFTIGFDDSRFNEAPYAAAVARHLGTEHTEILVTDAEAREVIPSLPEFYDEPFGDSSQIPTHLVCRAARTRVTVALSGDGGDELFGGYNRYFWHRKVWRRFDWIPFPLRQALGRALSFPSVDAWNHSAELMGKAGVISISRPGDKVHKLASRFMHVRTIDDLYKSLVSEWEQPKALIPHFAGEPPSMLSDPLPGGMHPLARMMAQDIRSYLPDDILCKVDRAAMGVSLETRVPFLDPRVVALSARIPMRMKIQGNIGKLPLRNILYKHVPRELIERPKAGFGIPVGTWLRGPLRSWAEDLLTPAALANDELLNPAPIRKAWAEHLSGNRDWTPRLWMILMLQSWRQHEA
ncbi:Asparagine synthetase [glutamine-hydrolyzing] 1 [Pigmentiphaga humi]|uniref:asparagine synthase (glutamine-hydrolyzing) n=1 Tax=Pigmentiphaga humi TaxID=2478468 RepID=A0A3P4B3A2_9BURK|nr:asparagine synthase (glutamine-hydrolyzing) [Pigmentiphaga humi]VCU70108.1 Asparagine synthetase [glutamine-hydrolyzing] 1 [Pigmentiphaga humi]